MLETLRFRPEVIYSAYAPKTTPYVRSIPIRWL